MSLVDRRTLLVGGGAGIGLILAWAWWPRRYGSALAPAKDEHVFGHYLKVGSDGRVTVAVPRAETGQGIWTGLAQIAADELGADWADVAVVPAPDSPVYDDLPLSGRTTAGATSIRALHAPLRQAAAAARDLLVRAAASRWDVPAAQCTAAGGAVSHEGKRLGFGALAEVAAGLELRDDAPLRAWGAGGLLGQPLPRLDLPAKSDGSLRFAGDVRLPRMLFAMVVPAPPGGRLASFDRSVRGLVADDQWLAAVAETGWAARQALKAARPRFTGSAEAGQAEIDAALDAAFAGSGESLLERGDFAAAVGGARPLGAVYRAAPAVPHGLEPASATARFGDGRLEVWAGAQDYAAAHRAAVDAAGLERGAVTLYQLPVGDGAGQALDAAAIAIAIALAARLKRPVQATLTASATQNRARPRTPLIARLAALPSPDGSIAAWRMKLAAAPGTDFGDAVPPYGFASLDIRHFAADLPITAGYMRGGAAALASFASESFLDEMARTLGSDPFGLRIGLLGGRPRLARCLTAVTALGGWEGGAPGSNIGLAAASAFGSHIALLARAGIGSDQRLNVERLVAAVDCGRVVNPDLVRQQVAGSLLQALALAATAAPDFVAGMAVARPAASVAFGRLGGTPQIDVELIASGADPGGVSGLGHLVAPAALANALAAGAGRRLRNLPFDLMSG